MENKYFFAFSNLYKGPLQPKNVNCEKNKFNWREICWLRYESNNFGLVKYKNTLTEEESFKEINYIRRGRKKIQFYQH